MKKWWSQFKFKKDENGKPTMFSYVIILGLVGLLLILIGNIFQDDQDNAIPHIEQEQITTHKESESPTLNENDKLAVIEEMETKFETQLKEMLEQLNGVSEVDIMVNLDATSLKVYQKNTIESQQSTVETDSNNGKRNIEEITKEEQTVIIRNNNQESPLLIQIRKPKVSGVMVVAKGLENLEVKQQVIDAVSRVLAVPTHRVTANPK